ncbi:tRNA wybutosine-synthesizing protein [Trichophaea hybrida]|nr:tRNA wybutosine-synthesizing protein [Trichophaea hybrida]
MAGIASIGPDASPKGSIDMHILPLINRLNTHADVVTTSSCSGRISVFLEGAKKLKTETYNDNDDSDDHNHVNHGRDCDNGQLQDVDPADEVVVAPGEKASSRPNAGVGGKGDGGRWLFVSHDPVDITRPIINNAEIANKVMERNANHVFDSDEYDLTMATRFVHFKFEPMILHIQTRTLEVAHIILSTALSTGFRESGIMNVALGKNQFPMVAVRSNGLAMDSIIGILDDTGKPQKVVDDDYIAMLVRVGNMRFKENTAKMAKLTTNLEDVLFAEKKDTLDGWEDKEARKARKRAEGLKRQGEVRRLTSGESIIDEVDDDIRLASVE